MIYFYFHDLLFTYFSYSPEFHIQENMKFLLASPSTCAIYIPAQHLIILHGHAFFIRIILMIYCGEYSRVCMYLWKCMYVHIYWGVNVCESLRASVGVFIGTCASFERAAKIFCVISLSRISATFATFYVFVFAFWSSRPDWFKCTSTFDFAYLMKSRARNIIQ